MAPLSTVAEQLPRGRHGLARSEVIASQRRRMLEAVTRCVARDGYAKTSVADVIAAAGVSRRTFYEHFRDKESCYLAAYEAAVMATLQAVAEGIERADDWVERVRGALSAYLRYLAEHPDSTRAFIVEVLAAGPRALAQRERVHAQFADFLRGARAEAGESLRLPELPDEAFDVMVGGIEHVVGEHIRAGRTKQLRELVPSLLYVQLALFAGHRVAGMVRDGKNPRG